MNSLVVVQVDPFSPGDEAASVTLESAHAEIVVFCYPCKLKCGDRVENHLFAVEAEAYAAFLADWSEDEKQARSVEKLEWLAEKGPYAYRGCGRVIEQASGLVEVLGFHIELEDLPCDGFAEFECMRISL